MKRKIRLNQINDIKKFCNICQTYDGDVIVSHGKYSVDGASLLGLLSLSFTEPFIIEISETGNLYKLISNLEEMNILCD